MNEIPKEPKFKIGDYVLGEDLDKEVKGYIVDIYKDVCLLQEKGRTDLHNGAVCFFKFKSKNKDCWSFFKNFLKHIESD